MFSIRQVFYLLTLLCILLLLLGLMVARWLWFYPMEKDLYLQLRQNELNSLISTVEQHQLQLLASVIEYAESDEIRRLPSPANANNANAPVSLAMDIMHLDVAFYINPKMELRFMPKSRASPSNYLIHDPNFLSWFQQLINDPDLINDEPQADVALIGNKAYFLVISPVPKLERKESGWVVLLQIIDKEILTAFSEITRIHLVPIPIPTGNQNFIGALSMPIYELMHDYQRCLYNKAQNPVLCLELRHDEGTQIPMLVNAETVLVYFFIIMLPVAMFASFLTLLTKPIIAATATLKRNSQEGHVEPLFTSARIPIKELRQLRSAYNDLVHIIQHQQNKLEELSITDRLTNIPNRRAFDKAMESTWTKMQKESCNIAVVLIDIDFFKLFNDHYGHLEGDTTLYKVAQALKQCARRHKEICCRIGGEEFALLVRIENEAEMQDFRQRLNNVVLDLKIPHAMSKVTEYVSISAGIIWIQNSGPWLEKFCPTDWIKAADDGLYMAKNAGRNQSKLCIVTPEQDFTTPPEWH